MRKKRIRRVLLAALTASMMVFAAIPVCAAGIDGPYSLTVTYAPDGVTLEEDTDFTLYKVGSFGWDDSGDAILVMDDVVGDYPASVDINIKKGDKTDEEWTGEWMASARALADYIVTQKPEGVPAKTATLPAGSGEVAISGLANGLYLLVGDGQVVTMDNVEKYCDPQPMFVLIFNKNGAVTVKPEIDKVKSLTVKKVWDNNGFEDEALLRPDGVGIKIYYGDELDATVELNADNDWSYTWETKKFDKTWRVVEFEPEGSQDYDFFEDYTISEDVTSAGYVKIYTVTNTYARHDLEIVKKTPEYVEHNVVSTSVIFELTGYKDGEVTYHHKAGMQVSAPGEQTITVPSIPNGLDELWVKEIYAGSNYKPDQGDKGKKADFIDGKYKVQFSNSYNGTHEYDGGVVNKYQKDGDSYKIVDRQGL